MLGASVVLTASGCASNSTAAANSIPPATSATSAEDAPSALETAVSGAPSMGIAAPPAIPCVPPRSPSDLSSLPGYVDLIVKVHLTGKRIESTFGSGSEYAFTSSAPLLGAYPNGLHIYSNNSTEDSTLPEGDYVLLLGTYDASKGQYFMVGGYRGAYSVKLDGLHQQCVRYTGTDGPAEATEAIALPQLIEYVSSWISTVAPQAAVATAGASKAASIPNDRPVG